MREFQGSVTRGSGNALPEAGFKERWPPTSDFVQFRAVYVGGQHLVA